MAEEIAQFTIHISIASTWQLLSEDALGETGAGASAILEDEGCGAGESGGGVEDGKGTGRTGKTSKEGGRGSGGAPVQLLDQIFSQRG